MSPSFVFVPLSADVIYNLSPRVILCPTMSRHEGLESQAIKDNLPLFKC